MATTTNLPDVVGQIYKFLEPLEAADRQKVVKSALTLLGDDTAAAQGADLTWRVHSGDDQSSFGTKAARWMNQNQISELAISELFHRDGGSVEVIVTDVLGDGKRGKTKNCYLLSGVRALLESDEPKFSEDDAVALCKLMGCHDAPNHAKTRAGLGNVVAGTKTSGFTLPAPGLRAAAELVKTMAAGA